jgi:site-specific recombinase XerD
MANYYFRLRDENATKPTPIILFVTYSGLRIKCKTKKTISPIDWGKLIKYQKDDKQKVSKNIKDIESRLSLLKGYADKSFNHFALLDKTPTPAEFLSKFYDLAGFNVDKTTKKEPKKSNLFEFITQFISEAPYRENPKTGRPISKETINTYRQCERYLLLYNKKIKRIDFADIDLDFYYSFKKLLAKENLSQNYISKHIKTLKTILNDAADRDITTNLKFKSRKFSAPQVDGDAIYLNSDELDELYNLDLTNNERLERTRDLFLIGCYTGLRYSDWAKVRFENIRGENLELITQKTNSRVSIPMPLNLKNILVKYNGTSPDMSNQKMNLYIKEVAEILVNKKIKSNGKKNVLGLSVVVDTSKYKRLATHTARRSFATNLYLEGIPAATIMKITTHTTERNFLKYIRMTNNEAAETISKHYQKKEAQKEKSHLKAV